jgi:hypothetical protein
MTVEQTQQQLFDQLVRATALVGLGLLIEYAVPVFKLIIAIWRWLFCGIVFDRSFDKTTAIAGIFVTVGVLWEGHVEFRQSVVEEEIRVENERKLAGVRDESKNALQKAAKELADARYRLSPWSLDSAAEVRIAAKLKRFPRVLFELGEDSHPYAAELTDTLDRVLNQQFPSSAGWQAIVPEGSPGLQRTDNLGSRIAIRSATNVKIEVPPPGTVTAVPPLRAVDFTNPGSALAAALNAEGIPTTLSPRPRRNAAAPDSIRGAIRITVGRKP